MTMKNVIGHCLCEKIKLNIKETELLITACHCGMCRRQNAGVTMYTPLIKQSIMRFYVAMSLFHSISQVVGCRVLFVNFVVLICFIRIKMRMLFI
ncbi:hypothetical protein Hs30E_07000 [Lactococcus hodotermopsidis]|uniref:CENP-V/GFA domain-containing protein n=1 Tax=Pseudolactococcus hodotermopsidis TaxID=2709157 RepID=A0A6A0B9M6_9LACT|nr:hypothetical protein Hs30E_07000 [Lactococcus hodotermopsidis]